MSVVVRHRAITAGRLSNDAFQRPRLVVRLVTRRQRSPVTPPDRLHHSIALDGCHHGLLRTKPMMTGLPDDRCVAVSHPGGDLAQTTVAYVARNVEQTDDHALQGRLTALDPPHGAPIGCRRKRQLRAGRSDRKSSATDVFGCERLGQAGEEAKVPSRADGFG
jgi:hypothetical protein